MYFISWLDRNSHRWHITARCSFYTCGYYSMSWVDPSSLAKLTWIHFAQHTFAHCNLLLCWGSSVHANSSTCIQLEYLYTWKCSITLATFIIVKYPVWLRMIFASRSLYHAFWVPFCMNCFISWFCSRLDCCKMHEVCFTEFCFSFLV